MKEIFKDKKSIYYSLAVMFTLIVGLSAVTFAYYVPDSEVGTEVVINTSQDIIKSDDLVNGSITVDAGSSKTFTLYVVSNSDIDTQYKLSYTVDSDMPNVDVYTEEEITDSITSYSVLPYTVHIDNYGEEALTVTFDITSGVIGAEVDPAGHELVSAVVE